jgi:hypothetical protein
MYNNAKRTRRKLQRFISTVLFFYNCYITRYAGAYQRPRDVICDYERDGVRWCKILHLTGYDVSDAVRTTLALNISMSIIQVRTHTSMRVHPIRELFLSHIMHNGYFPIPIFTLLHRPSCGNLTNVLCCYVHVTCVGYGPSASKSPHLSLTDKQCFKNNPRVRLRSISIPNLTCGLSVLAINPTVGPRVVTLHSAKSHHLNIVKRFRVNHFRLTNVLLLPNTSARRHIVVSDYGKLLGPWGLFRWYSV